MKTALPLLALLVCGGCYVEEPLKKQKADNNKTYDVEYLFEHEGCKVYRFKDRGTYIYFTNCNGEAVSTTDSTQIRNVIRKQ